MKYKEDYIALHENKSLFFKGQCILLFKDQIHKLVKETNSKTVLDYGSGKGRQYLVNKLHLYWGVKIRCYDPGVMMFSDLPDRVFDGVVCTEVMEHIPEEEVDQTLKNIFNRATKFVFFSIALNPSNSDGGKTLLDGSNVHVTIKPREWWSDKISKHNKNNINVVIVFGEGTHNPNGFIPPHLTSAFS